MKDPSGSQLLEHFLLSLGDEAIRIFSFAGNALDEWGYNRCAVIETSRGVAVAEAGRCGEVAQKNRMRYGELRGGIKHLQSQQSMLMTTTERKNKLMKGLRRRLRNVL